MCHEPRLASPSVLGIVSELSLQKPIILRLSPNQSFFGFKYANFERVFNSLIISKFYVLSQSCLCFVLLIAMLLACKRATFMRSKLCFCNVKAALLHPNELKMTWRRGRKQLFTPIFLSNWSIFRARFSYHFLYKKVRTECSHR